MDDRISRDTGHLFQVELRNLNVFLDSSSVNCLESNLCTIFLGSRNGTILDKPYFEHGRTKKGIKRGISAALDLLVEHGRILFSCLHRTPQGNRLA